MKIVVVDDHPLARKGIISILQDNIKDCCISEETCIEGALNALRKLEPELKKLEATVSNTLHL